VRKVGDDHGVGSTSRFVEEYQVGDFLGETSLDERRHDRIASIQTVGVGKDES
jgi:hypothetical protein